DRRQPIVSFSLGLPVQFQFGGSERHHPLKTFALEHGDVLVWGGRSRLNYHAVRPVRPPGQNFLKIRESHHGGAPGDGAEQQRACHGFCG
ncbi:alpha-ketoglutarate-dependent dioxygenase AlkB, partial [Pseudoalteromonas sp. SIMBA_148]